MSHNVYLRMHIYKGHEEATSPEDGRAEWIGAFEEVEIKHPLRRAINNDCPLIHVCLFGGGNIYWVMVPDHVKALAQWYPDRRIFNGEIGGTFCYEMTGQEFLDHVKEYEGGHYRGPIFKLGEWFS